MGIYTSAPLLRQQSPEPSRVQGNPASPNHPFARHGKMASELNNPAKNCCKQVHHTGAAHDVPHARGLIFLKQFSKLLKDKL